MRIKVSADGIIKHRADIAVVAVPRSGGKPAGGLASLDKAAGGVIAECMKHRDLLEADDLITLPASKGGYKALIAVPRGKEDPGSLDLQRKLAAVGARLAELKAASAVVDLPSFAGDQPWAVRQAAQALGASAHEFRLGGALRKRGPAEVTLVAGTGGKGSPSPARSLRIGSAIAEGMRVAMHLGEQPPNQIYPDSLAKAAAKFGRAAGLKVKVHDHVAIRRMRMGGLLGVGQGSARPPRLIVLEHAGGRKGAAPLVLVGKGITFDTGGNSLKPSSAMMDMKFDMCGAAGVIGAMIACGRMKLPINVAAVVPSAENMVAGNSIRPDDILTMMDGQKVEVLNTDAEGRLILADALTYAQRFLKPRAIVDAATLTGACLVALGQHRSGMCSSSDSLAAELGEAGDDCADPCWRLPLDDDYDRLLKSEIADMSNIGGGRNAGTITAACFLRRFVKVKEWGHLDIAGTAWQKRRATGRPVPLLATWLARRAKWL